MILDIEKAAAVYVAITSVAGVGCYSGKVQWPAPRAQEIVAVAWDETGIEVRRGVLGGPREGYQCFDDFAAAYQLEV